VVCCAAWCSRSALFVGGCAVVCVLHVKRQLTAPLPAASPARCLKCCACGAGLAVSVPERNAHADLICFAGSISLGRLCVSSAVSLFIARACAAVLCVIKVGRCMGGWRMVWCMLDGWEGCAAAWLHRLHCILLGNCWCVQSVLSGRHAFGVGAATCSIASAAAACAAAALAGPQPLPCGC
jgi:hypothetical protein